MEDAAARTGIALWEQASTYMRESWRCGQQLLPCIELQTKKDPRFAATDDFLAARKRPKGGGVGMRPPGGNAGDPPVSGGQLRARPQNAPLPVNLEARRDPAGSRLV